MDLDEGDGDVYLLGRLAFDCPPYEIRPDSTRAFTAPAEGGTSEAQV